MTYFKSFSRLQQFFIVFFLMGTFVTLVSLRHFTVILLWSAAVILTVFLSHKKQFLQNLGQTLKHPAFLLLALLLAWAFMSCLWSLRPLQSFKTTLSQSATLLLWALLFTHLKAWKEETGRLLMKCLVPLIILSGLMLVIQNIGLGSFKTWVGFTHSTLKTNVTLLLTLSIPVAAYLHLQCNQKGIPLLILGMAFFLCCKTNYLAGLLGMVIAGVAAGLSYGFPRFIPLIMAYGTALLCMILPLLFHLILPLINIKTLETTYIGHPLFHLRPFSHRLYIWEFVSERVGENLWLGWGAATSRGFPTDGITVLGGFSILPSHPHNHIMQVWLEMGLIGAVLLALVHFMVFRAISKLKSPLATAWATFFTLTTFVILSLSHSIWHKWWVTWLGAMIVLLIRIALPKKRPRLRRGIIN